MTLDEQLDAALLRFESAKAIWDDVDPEDPSAQHVAHKDLERAEADLSDLLPELVERLRWLEKVLAEERVDRNRAFAMAAAPTIEKARQEALERFEKTLPEEP